MPDYTFHISDGVDLPNVVVTLQDETSAHVQAIQTLGAMMLEWGVDGPRQAHITIANEAGAIVGRVAMSFEPKPQ